MNYVELHIGDYDKATAHLTACEDGIYGRLLRRYYDTEAPLPLELKSLQRLVRARTRDEKAAVETVLEEFFQSAADGWHHKRCDEEIERYQEKREKAKRSAEARWAAPRKASERNANASETHDERNARQSPVTSHQEKASPPASTQATAEPVASPTAAGRACRLMREAGCVTSNPSHPDLLAALAEGVTPETLADTVREAIDAGKPKPFAWAIATARGRREEGAKPIAPGAPRHETARGLSAVDRIAANVQRAQQRDAERGDDVLEGEAVRLAR